MIPLFMQHYFDILGLQASFTLDEAALEKAYFAAQRTHHPDRAVGKPEAERLEAFHMSQRINEAYEALKNPLSRAEHLLLMRGIAVNGEDDRDVPPALLMEMMDLRERLADSAGEGVALAAMVAEIKALALASQQVLAAAFEAKDYALAARETRRFAYLGKAMEEAHMHIYRLKAMAVR